MSFVNINFEEEYDEVDFDQIVEPILPKKKETEKLVKKIEYDKTTIEKYRVFRLRKMDPIAYLEIEDEYAFKFKYIWDPYTGEKKDIIDEHGPLCFDPDILINYYLTKILSKLWVQPSDEHGGFYQGYYDDGAGAGDDFYVSGRGHHPEWYVFRLPIIDCYLTVDHNKQYITFGPRLSDDEILEIENLANKRPDNFKNLFGHKRPSLSEMKRLYDQAISKTPTIPTNSNDIPDEELKKLYCVTNRDAIDKLVKIATLK